MPNKKVVHTICTYCHTPFKGKRFPREHYFCTNECYKAYVKVEHREHPCLECSKTTTNPKFCSIRCAALFNNREYPKRRTKKRCVVCGDPVKGYRYSRCSLHWDEYKRRQLESYKSLTIGEYRNRLSVRGKHPSWLHAQVRAFARQWHKDLVGTPCVVCSYGTHTHLCHRRAVSDFPDSTLLGVVNAKENLLVLCPNHHWEFDHGLLTDW
jgi:hypothetical protein